MFIRLGVFDGKSESRRSALLDFGGEMLGIARNRLALAHDPLGAPLLLIDGARGAWNVSSSSRENVYLFGLARGQRIGVDIEISEPIDPPRIALHDAEAERLEGLPESRRASAFLDLWTAKEAWLKALGVGLRREPSLICVTPSEGGGFTLTDEGPQTLATARQWRETIVGKTAICAALTLHLSP